MQGKEGMLGAWMEYHAVCGLDPPDGKLPKMDLRGGFYIQRTNTVV